MHSTDTVKNAHAMCLISVLMRDMPSSWVRRGTWVPQHWRWGEGRQCQAPGAMQSPQVQHLLCGSSPQPSCNQGAALIAVTKEWQLAKSLYLFSPCVGSPQIVMLKALFHVAAAVGQLAAKEAGNASKRCASRICSISHMEGTPSVDNLEVPRQQPLP